ncbi:hypothetical protein [Algivirga pacifica]|uniref:Antitoxin component YwqK of the YwqJK toxin-antitoxin module n=1 Tax=Algivirga pacifica TaxID=1162670 RepID=A0ABP9DJ64_9BACT
MIRKILFVTFLFFTLQGWAQDKGKKTSPQDSVAVDLSSMEEGVPTIELNPGAKLEEENRKRKKKKKRNVFWGVKTKRKFTKTTRNGKTTFELFYVLKSWDSPNAYPYQKYYYNSDARAVVQKQTVFKKHGMPLHGPYYKIVEGDTVVTGQFYKGVRTGRWTAYQKNNVLDAMMVQDKKYYYMGFPKDAEVSYYDADQKRVKEVIPYQHGLKDGYYLKYYPSGALEIVGLYKEDEKVGIWMEYYDRKDRIMRRKEIQHRKDPFDEGFEPYVRKEWTKTGKKTYDHKK